jgi:hypothetical protein
LLRSVHGAEVLGSDGLSEADIEDKHAYGFFTEVYLNRERVSGGGNVSGDNWHSWAISADDVDCQHVVATVMAVNSAVDQSLREVVESDIHDDLSPNSGLSSWADVQDSGKSLAAGIFGWRWTSIAREASFDLTSAAATITTDSVAIITSKDEFLTITTNFLAERISSRLEETKTAGIAWVAIGATWASSGAGQASQLLVVPPGTSRAWNSGSSRGGGCGGSCGSGGNDGSGDTGGSVPDLARGAGDASLSVVVWWGRAASNTLVVVEDAVGVALSALSSTESKDSIAEVEEVGGSVDLDALSIGSNREAEGGASVGDDEAGDTPEESVQGAIGSSSSGVLVAQGANIFIIEHVVAPDTVDWGVINDVGDEQRVNLSGWGGWDEKSDAGCWDALDDQLHIVGSPEVTVRVDWADLKSIEECQGLPLIALGLGGDVGNDLFSRCAGWQGSGVDLVVSSIDEVGGFSQIVEGYFSPTSISPLSPDDEGNDCVTVGMESLDGEEEVVTGSTFHMGDTCINWQVPMATLGGQSKALVRVRL